MAVRAIARKQLCGRLVSAHSKALAGSTIYSSKLEVNRGERNANVSERIGVCDRTRVPEMRSPRPDDTGDIDRDQPVGNVVTLRELINDK